MNTWTLYRTRNKPHLRKRGGIWVVALRPGFQMQGHLEELHRAQYFARNHNEEFYALQISKRFGV